MKVLSNTTTTTKAVLQAVSDGQWWKKSLAYLRPHQVSKALALCCHNEVSECQNILRNLVLPSGKERAIYFVECSAPPCIACKETKNHLGKFGKAKEENESQYSVVSAVFL